VATVLDAARGRSLDTRRFVPIEDDSLMSSRPVVLRLRRKVKLVDGDGRSAVSPVRARHKRTCGQCGGQVTGKRWFSNAFYQVLCRKCFYGSVSD
jgi:hypothetical protein